jgi:hypothetical protein
VSRLERAAWEQQSQRVQRLVELADVACERLPVRVKIEGQFFDLAALLKNLSLNGEASSTCMEPQGIVEDAFTRRRGVM